MVVNLVNRTSVDLAGLLRRASFALSEHLSMHSALRAVGNRAFDEDHLKPEHWGATPVLLAWLMRPSLPRPTSPTVNVSSLFLDWLYPCQLYRKAAIMREQTTGERNDSPTRGSLSWVRGGDQSENDGERSAKLLD